MTDFNQGEWVAASAGLTTPQSALIWLGKAGSQLWFELGGKEILFYLKSGKPQEVTLRRFFLLPRPGKHTKVFIGLHACAVRGLRKNTQFHKHSSFAHGWPGLMGNLHGKGSHYTSGYTCGTTYIHKHPSLLIFQVQRRFATVSLPLPLPLRAQNDEKRSVHKGF